jgi:hypothetical protein
VGQALSATLVSRRGFSAANTTFIPPRPRIPSNRYPARSSPTDGRAISRRRSERTCGCVGDRPLQEMSDYHRSIPPPRSRACTTRRMLDVLSRVLIATAASTQTYLRPRMAVRPSSTPHLSSWENLGFGAERSCSRRDKGLRTGPGVLVCADGAGAAGWPGWVRGGVPGGITV